MKNNIILKSAALGSIIGIAVTVGMLTGLCGKVIYFLSLGFVLDYFRLADEELLIVTIPFFIVVWTIYGTITGILLKKFKTE